jgi:hypothetical protein
MLIKWVFFFKKKGVSCTTLPSPPSLLLSWDPGEVFLRSLASDSAVPSHLSHSLRSLSSSHKQGCSLAPQGPGPPGWTPRLQVLRQRGTRAPRLNPKASGTETEREAELLPESLALHYWNLNLGDTIRFPRVGEQSASKFVWELVASESFQDFSEQSNTYELKSWARKLGDHIQSQSGQIGCKTLSWKKKSQKKG